MEGKHTKAFFVLFLCFAVVFLPKQLPDVEVAWSDDRIPTMDDHEKHQSHETT